MNPMNSLKREAFSNPNRGWKSRFLTRQKKRRLSCLTDVKRINLVYGKKMLKVNHQKHCSLFCPWPNASYSAQSCIKIDRLFCTLGKRGWGILSSKVRSHELTIILSTDLKMLFPFKTFYSLLRQPGWRRDETCFLLLFIFKCDMDASG